MLQQTELKWPFDCNKRSTVFDLSSAKHCFKHALSLREVYREMTEISNRTITMDTDILT